MITENGRKISHDGDMNAHDIGVSGSISMSGLDLDMTMHLKEFCVCGMTGEMDDTTSVRGNWSIEEVVMESEGENIQY